MPEENKIMFYHNRTDDLKNQYTVSYIHGKTNRKEILFGVYFFKDGEQILKQKAN